jgi:FtsP/CotA-like multicopper oxidase with cupredoxin domain
MEEGQMTWGRVDNDIADQNLTMASTRPSSAPSGDLEPLIQAVQATCSLIQELLFYGYLLASPQHWHGLSQRTAPFSDGTPQVSQWPIAPLNYFDYEVHPELGDAGTYFYHSRVGFQAISASGAPIVKNCRAPPYQYDDDIILQLSDYYNKTDANITTELLANPFKWSGETNALLVNG